MKYDKMKKSTISTKSQQSHGDITLAQTADVILTFSCIGVTGRIKWTVSK